MDERIYFIYKYTFPNGKVYIGQTYKGSRRFGRVASYKDMLVRRAMDKYPSFKKEIIEYCSKDNVDERESFYITFFNSMNKEFGYNLTSGGSTNKVLAESVKKRLSEKHKGKVMSQDMKEKVSKAVIQIDPNTLNAIQRFYSVLEASRQTGIEYTTISSVCRRKSSTAGGYYWCFESDYDDSYLPRELKKSGHIYTDEQRRAVSERTSGMNNPMYGSHRKLGDNPHAIPVLQFDLDGNYVAKYDCAKTASIVLGQEQLHSSICKCARGALKSAGKYIWRYEGSTLKVDPYVRKTTIGYKHTKEAKEKMREFRLGKLGGPKAKPVLQFSLEGKIIKEYPSANSAEKELGITTGKISLVCKGERKTAGGYYWEYKYDGKKVD